MLSFHLRSECLINSDYDGVQTMAVLWCSLLLTVLRRKFECTENRLRLMEGTVLLSCSEKSKAVEIHV